MLMFLMLLLLLLQTFCLLTYLIASLLHRITGAVKYFIPDEVTIWCYYCAKNAINLTLFYH